MNTIRGSQYSIQSDGGGPRSRIDHTKGTRKGKIPSVTESTHRSAISQTQVPEMHILSELEFELIISNSKREKLHSEGSNRHIHEPVQGKILGNAATNPPRSD
ncbi:hypothetical protein O181_008075 [Austropuccinia psidii MF-1]|uniref:Uncharacterized protein n=1 Tax=Austropuccinia psidii MF-1 TaxID=1389203 RepID=A0A9Q3BP88_9BASI|nr:hypothetical protein [Austropuccinia psidii MF-1]